MDIDGYEREKAEIKLLMKLQEAEEAVKDESYEKNYLIGKYGAIPTLKSIDILKGAGCPGDIGSAPIGV